MKYSSLSMLGIMLLLTAGVCFGQQSKDIKQIKKEINALPNHKFYQVVYDKKFNKTVVSVGGAASGSDNSLALLFGRGQQVFFNVIYIFDGQSTNRSAEGFYWIFSVLKRKGWSEVTDRTLFVTADNENFTLPEGYRPDAFPTSVIGKPTDDRLRRQLTYYIDRPMLQKLAAAKNLTVKIDNREVTIDPEKRYVFADALILSEIK